MAPHNADWFGKWLKEVESAISRVFHKKKPVTDNPAQKLEENAHASLLPESDAEVASSNPNWFDKFMTGVANMFDGILKNEKMSEISSSISAHDEKLQVGLVEENCASDATQKPNWFQKCMSDFENAILHIFDKQPNTATEAPICTSDGSIKVGSKMNRNKAPMGKKNRNLHSQHPNLYD